jgi:hypothetical protein
MPKALDLRNCETGGRGPVGVAGPIAVESLIPRMSVFEVFHIPSTTLHEFSRLPIAPKNFRSSRDSAEGFEPGTVGPAQSPAKGRQVAIGQHALEGLAQGDGAAQAFLHLSERARPNFRLSTTDYVHYLPQFRSVFAAHHKLFAEKCDIFKMHVSRLTSNALLVQRPSSVRKKCAQAKLSTTRISLISLRPRRGGFKRAVYYA